jgi:iron complex outermembrane receptor protein
MNIVTEIVRLRRRALIGCATCLVLATAVHAQVATSAPANEKKSDDVLNLSVYRVNSTQDSGYIAKSATPFKTQQQTVDIPQAITVVTRDMMDDIGEFDLAKTMVYVGGVPKFGGELYQLRGSNAFSTYPVVDGMTTRTVYMDNIFIDTIEIIRGPAALLYPNSQLSGVVNKTSKRPQAKSMASIRTSITDYGLYRVSGDFTGPIAKVGDGQLNYRLVGGGSRGDGYFKNTKEDRTMLHPTFQWDNAKTSVMIAYDYQEIARPSNPTAVLQPNGKIFTGNGRESSTFLPPGATETHTHNGVRANAVHQLFEGWETRIGLDWNKMHRIGSVVLPTGGVNWDTRTITFLNRKNNIHLENASIAWDTNGRYEIAGMQNQTTFGLNVTMQKASNKLWNNENYGGTGVRLATRPIDGLDMNTLPALPLSSFVSPANPGNRVRSEFSNFYIQQNVEVIKDHLLLVGGFAKFKDETNNLANYLVNTATLAKVNANLHRVGVVAQFLDKKLAIYAMTANTQLPSSPTAILADGTSVPGASGKGKEVGVKVSLFENKLNATLSVFDLDTTGLAVFGGVLPDGRTFNTIIGKTEQKGIDGEISLSLSRQFEVVTNFYSGKVKDQNGNPVDDSYKSTIGVLAKYSFRDGGAKGLALGVGGYRTSGRVTATGALTYAGKPTFITNDSDPVVKVFANYNLNQHWSFKVEVENVFDGLTPQAINSATLLETNIGRSFTFHAAYSF